MPGHRSKTGFHLAPSVQLSSAHDQATTPVEPTVSAVQTLLAQQNAFPISGPLRESVPPRARFNEIEVQHISDQLHQQIFGSDPPKPPPDLVELARLHLDLHDLLGKQSAPTDPIGFELPKLHGKSLDEHFFKLGTHTGQPWLGLAQRFSEAASELPSRPVEWSKKPGWTKYEGNKVIDGKGPDEEEMLVFDVEVLYKISPYAVLACAASPTAWYSWISPQVLGESDTDKHLISFGDPKKQRIVIGHNVSYDRARIAEEYNLEQTGNFFLDTMSLHAAVNGMCSRQRPTWMKHRKNQELKEKIAAGVDPELSTMMNKAVEELEPELWVDHSSMNSLRDVAAFHCGISVSKETRDMMGEMKNVKELESNLDACLSYCAIDVATTHQVFKSVMPAFLVTCPHPVSFSALRHMGSLLLPVNSSWSNYVETSEKTYTDLLAKVKSHLESLTEQAVNISFGSGTREEMLAAEQRIVAQTALLSEENKRYERILAEEKKLLTKEKMLTKSLDKKPVAGKTKVATAESNAEPEIKPETEQAPKKRGRPKKVANETKTLLPKAQKELEAIKTTLKELESKKAAALKTVTKMENTLALLKSSIAQDKSKAEERIIDISRNPWKPENAWLSQLDWSGREIKYKKQKKPTDPLVPVARQKLPGYPSWYKDLFPKTDGPMSISVRTRVATLMLRLTWDGFPLVWTDKHGWTFRVPLKDAHQYAKTPLAICDELETESNPHVANDTNGVYYKLPHNGNGSTRCVNPLAKGYQRYFEAGVMTSEYALAKEALDMNAACSYWISARERIKSQFVVWENPKDEEANIDMKFVPNTTQTLTHPTEGVRANTVILPAENLTDSSDKPAKVETEISPNKEMESSINPDFTPRKDLGLILPQIVTMGTITRRAVENTWLTASNAKKNRVGSELKAMIQAPPGYCFVGADVDSEELWIASLIGDAEFKMHGGNAIGFMTLEGSKAQGTDMHSRTADVLGISRNNAKVFNYGRIYGAGLKFAASLLRQFNPKVNEAEANVIAGNLYTVTKGTKTTKKVLSEKPFWRGGTESFVFNKLEEFADQHFPKTPVLGAGITQALQKAHINKGAFLTSRINWAIQSSGVDYLHLLIVSMDYLIQQYNLKARLMITVHDEIRYIVQTADRYKVAMALQIANLWTRSMFAQQMGINDLPQSCAFFSAVDIDHVLRKEVDLDCVTPSNPIPIAPGESVDITQLLANPDAQLPIGQERTPPEAFTDIVYEPRKPILEELAEQSKTNIYMLKAQVAKTDKDVLKVIKEMKIEAPELMRQTPARGARSIHDTLWEDDGSDPWNYITMQGTPLDQPRQEGYGWEVGGDPQPAKVARKRFTVKRPQPVMW
ncbi:hypothetical protein H072_1479 [Dactylellina haptotyla CBS 200.50]|uniref:DNA-directed DNA polymerase n=1 Tax=Dactylellina haptotyla (strain CBS 200.50) TaxID=1284197 RepID=S8BYK7_DACHA|nr:hypothetical protein H072_1479 [Dactylellina haptotyla CBS 200.50]